MQDFEPMIRFLEQVAQVVSMKCKPHQKSIRNFSHQQSSQKALFSGFKAHRHGTETLHWGFERKSFAPNDIHKLPLVCILWQEKEQD